MYTNLYLKSEPPLKKKVFLFRVEYYQKHKKKEQKLLKFLQVVRFQEYFKEKNFVCLTIYPHHP